VELQDSPVENLVLCRKMMVVQVEDPIPLVVACPVYHSPCTVARASSTNDLCAGTRSHILKGSRPCVFTSRRHAQSSVIDEYVIPR
jgi:hypothetical protein